MIILKKAIKNKSILSLFVHKLKGNRPELPQFIHSMLITNCVFTRLTRRVSLEEQELSSPLVFSGVRVTRCLVLYVFFVDRFFSFFLLTIVLFVLRLTGF